ncbi:hypothetical protein TREES_T100014265 [Tupaia chinensis]|uniref:Uncharacterized protein n=1 Tax=Tupaia chinensis TaxID=246437 RepID=L9JEV7_TUPCH|nr:hypothetical protein TREES_T100014265 [Tupaia chinensis]
MHWAHSQGEGFSAATSVEVSLSTMRQATQTSDGKNSPWASKSQNNCSEEAHSQGSVCPTRSSLPSDVRAALAPGIRFDGAFAAGTLRSTPSWHTAATLPGHSAREHAALRGIVRLWGTHWPPSVAVILFGDGEELVRSLFVVGAVLGTPGPVTSPGPSCSVPWGLCPVMAAEYLQVLPRVCATRLPPADNIGVTLPGHGL